MTQPYMMGEGLGTDLGLQYNKKYTQWVSPREAARKAAGEAEYKLELKLLQRKKTEKEHYFKAIANNVLKAKLNEKGALVGHRIFMVKWNYTKWEERANHFGGIPEGIDVALTPFGHLLLVPVIEEEEAKQTGLANVKVEPKAKRVDVFGRRFWVKAELKDFCTKVFGTVDWKRPITVEEAKQFGVSLL